MTEASGDAPRYQFRFHLTREDVAAFEWLPREMAGAEKLWFLGPILACGAAAGLLEDELRPIVPWDPSTKFGQVLSVMCAIAVGYAIGAVLFTVRTRFRIRRAAVPAGPVAVDAHDDRVTQVLDGTTQTYAWRDVTVTSTATHVFLVHARHTAIILPLRAFSSLDAMQAFASFAEASGRDPGDDPTGQPDDAGGQDAAAPRETRT